MALNDLRLGNELYINKKYCFRFGYVSCGKTFIQIFLNKMKEKKKQNKSFENNINSKLAVIISSVKLTENKILYLNDGFQEEKKNAFRFKLQYLLTHICNI